VNGPIPTISIVIPAYNAEPVLPRCLAALEAEKPAGTELIVVDNGSQDATVEVARSFGAKVLHVAPHGLVGKARNCGWDAATGDVLVFLDADALVGPGWGSGLLRAVEEYPGSVIGCARKLVGRNAWSWVAQLQIGSPWIARGEPRCARQLPSFCLAVPRSAPLRWAEDFGGEDGVFAADALRAGLTLVFDPRFHAVHNEYRDTFADVRRWQRRFSYGKARCGPLESEGPYKRLLSRAPIHYFALVRLPVIYRRLRHEPELRSTFIRYLPHMVVAEWALGMSAMRFVVRRPPLR
jgi:glycosyltransferase involved in cell wall biosynthesis